MISISKLRLIEPKLYNYIEFSRTPNKVIGFEAQQVNQHLPEAISLSTNYIPNIYENKNINIISSSIIEIFDITGQTLNDTLQLCSEDKTFEVIIIQNNINSIICEIRSDNTKLTLNNNNFNQLTNTTTIFVYGKKVNDFHTLNKDYLFTINFAATQELDRQLQWHTKGIDNSVSGNAEGVYGASLYLENQQLKQQINNILQRLNNANI
jgi:hypothetical protein